jgi:Tol biopolymer transport system component/tRNA A-37 threonylcarbamoyl transferase component Bud32
MAGEGGADRPNPNGPDAVATDMHASIAPGTRIGDYAVESRLGEGGMGEVWKARDTRVPRHVAIKRLRSEFAHRFHREADAIARLNHPHICTLFDVGPNYLVMELCEGPTLADRLRRGALAMRDVQKFGAQIASALAEAHAQGIAHRDLKPGNIILVKNGVKVLDFGLAKSIRDDTITASHTILGTPAYMAPEQRCGEEGGPASDIYALGLILSEMATGTRGSVAGLSGPFAHIVRRCLADDPHERWQSAADIKAQLEWLLNEPADAANTPQPAFPWTWAAALVVALLAGVAIARLVPSSAPPEGAAQSVPTQFDLSIDFESSEFSRTPQPSPDGRFLAYLGRDVNHNQVLRVRGLGDAEPRTLAGTENARELFWSADSLWIGFVVDDKIRKVAPTGGPAETMFTVSGAVQEPIWGSHGDILFRSTNRAPLSRISDSGGSPEVVTRLDASRTENSHRGQQFLPDGRRFIFTARCADRSMNALYLASLDTKATKRLMPIDSEARFVASDTDRGWLVYARDGALVGRRLNLTREEVEGEAVVVLDHIGYVPASLLVSFAVSADGRLAVGKSVATDLGTLEWYGRDGVNQGSLGVPGQWSQVRLSPDGSRVAVSGVDPQTGNRDVFTFDMRGVLLRLTLNGANDWFPIWSPDGHRLAFASDRPGGGLFLKAPTSAESPEELLLKGGLGSEDWSADGRWIVGSSNEGPWISEARAGASPQPLRLSARGEASGISFSPDGRWIAYVSTESGMSEVYVRGFQGPGVTPEAIQVSRSGGDFPVWNPAGGELFFTSPDSSLWSFGTKGLARSEVLDPLRLFRPCPSSAFVSAPTRRTSYMRAFDTHDGKRFLVTCAVDPPGRFSVFLNWLRQGLQAREKRGV